MTTMSFVAFSSRARNARSASRVGVGSALWIALKETSVLLAFRLEVDEAEVGRTAARDEVQRAEVPDGDHRARPSDRGEDGLPVDEFSQGPSEVLAKRLRETQRHVGEFSEHGGQTSRSCGCPSSSRSRTAGGLR